jgi:hypothetical protein
MAAIVPKQQAEIVPSNPAQEPSIGADNTTMPFAQQCVSLLTNVGKLAEKVQDVVADQSKQIEAQAKRIDQLSTMVVVLETKLNTQNILHQAEIKALKGQFSSLAERVEKLDGRKI